MVWIGIVFAYFVGMAITRLTLNKYATTWEENHVISWSVFWPILIAGLSFLMALTVVLSPFVFIAGGYMFKKSSWMWAHSVWKWMTKKRRLKKLKKRPKIIIEPGAEISGIVQYRDMKRRVDQFEAKIPIMERES